MIKNLGCLFYPTDYSGGGDFISPFIITRKRNVFNFMLVKASDSSKLYKYSHLIGSSDVRTSFL